MGSFLSSTKKSMELDKNKESMELDKNTALDKAKELSTSSPVVVFSKTYCGYCKRVKQLFTQIGASFKVIELDEQSDGGDIQLALGEWTGQRTVPNVFIGGKHIGGCDTVLGKYHGGQLLPLLTDAGATVNNSAQL
ncbi:hypothetical protein K2173_022823 [Erythroxylum novogranatense]|uniref:Glutaredoxin n=1 Tax=Erythroxylum novogranatense TaxID=1862640 RepID=A0AAV8SMU5_9ROSI|nr:hypothetical protein K2173_022823 [Erythroxylum novogranatense]